MQPVAATREKQLRLWRELVVRYHQGLPPEQAYMSPGTFPLFRNEEIGRSLSPEAVQVVVESLLAHGNAEWEDERRSSLRILLRSPEQLSNEVYEWVRQNGLFGSVYTMYELHASDEDDFKGSGLLGVDPSLLRRALILLEKADKAQIIHGDSSEDDGVKFIQQR